HTRFDCDWSSDVCSADLSGFPGVPRGASSPSHWPVSKPGKPDSCSVGTSGMVGKRSLLVKARILMRPLLWCGISGVEPSTPTGTDRKSVVQGTSGERGGG